MRPELRVDRFEGRSAETHAWLRARLGRALPLLLRYWALEDGRFSLVHACEGDRVIGFVAWTSAERGWVTSMGTWVAPGHRGTGLARRLWLRAVAEIRPRGVVVTTVTMPGSRFVKLLVPYFRRKGIGLDWDDQTMSVIEDPLYLPPKRRKSKAA